MTHPRYHKTAARAGLEFRSLSERQRARHHEALRLSEVHAVEQGEGIRCAVIDTGIDQEHEEFAGASIEAVDCTRSKYGPEDRDGHGTHCMGLLGGRTLGAAPKCELIAIKGLGDDGYGEIDDLCDAIDKALDLEADVISASWGCYQSDRKLLRWVRRARQAGALFLAAAGNDGVPKLDYPARWRETFGVGGVGFDRSLAWFSNYGPDLDCVVYAVEIYSAQAGGGYVTTDGTSMACPIAAGIAALRLAMWRKEHGDEAVPSMEIIREHVLEHSIDLGEPGWDEKYAGGLIDPVDLCDVEPTPIPVPDQYIVHQPSRLGDAFSVEVLKG